MSDVIEILSVFCMSLSFALVNDACLSRPVPVMVVSSLASRLFGPIYGDHLILTDCKSDFLGTPRFELLEKLGDGGMGVVYRVLDHEQGIQVALKRMRPLGSRGFIRFKNSSGSCFGRCSAYRKRYCVLRTDVGCAYDKRSPCVASCAIGSLESRSSREH